MSDSRRGVEKSVAASCERCESKSELDSCRCIGWIVGSISNVAGAYIAHRFLREDAVRQDIRRVLESGQWLSQESVAPDANIPINEPQATERRPHRSGGLDAAH
jgi:hypothetical protein